MYPEFDGIHIGRKRVARLMRAAGLAGVSRRRGCRTTITDRRAVAASDLVHRRFTAAEPNRIWTADITYVPTWQGFLYLAVVLVESPDVSTEPGQLHIHVC
ncbi:hypothetical protein GCM10018952_61660 [Streptosporangium vulgare]